MSKRVSDICDRIWRTIDHNKDDPVDILNALWACYVREVSLFDCDDCREQAVYALETSCPDMLKRADAAAAKRMRDGAREGGHTIHTCH